MSIPIFNNECICIVDRKKMPLAAVISSYLHKKGTFLNIFEFSSATIIKPNNFTEAIDEHSMSKSIIDALSIQIHNGINKAGGCENLILAGLDEKQKSYLTYLDKFYTIEIDSIEDIEACLGGIAYEKEEFLSVLPEEIPLGLLKAGRENLKLQIDNTATSLENKLYQNIGLVVIENNNTTSVISAINYALSINLDVELINPYSESEIKEIGLLLEDWQNGNYLNYYNLIEKLKQNLPQIDFSKYDFVTFFTTGAPYSLVLDNIIPISYVHLNQYPNLFILDNIFYEKQALIGSSVVFSPLEFGIDEETDFVIKSFQENNYWVKELIGNNASSYNIDMHVKEYPYDVFHICSHGGEVNGYSVSKEFIDRDGNKHIVEYDDVISFYPKKGESLIGVGTKHIWRKFNGFVWKSKELEAQNYSHYVFADMLNSIIDDRKSKKRYTGVPKSVVPNSCAIKCSDFIYQASFNMVAGFHTSPIIFNNTCWSWFGIAETFLNSGARGYIGTLRAIDNKIAKDIAETFYKHVFSDTILNSFYLATNKIKGTSYENIYIYWGLHFSTLKNGISTDNSLQNIARRLIHASHRWFEKYKNHSNREVKENSIKLSKWNHEEFFVNILPIIRKRRKK